MNKNTKKVVYEILENDELAREDTLYLVYRTLMKMLECNGGTALGIVIQGMKYKGISFEGITRAKRKWIEENKEKISREAEQIRRQEEELYKMEFSNYNHIPRID